MFSTFLLFLSLILEKNTVTRAFIVFFFFLEILTRRKIVVISPITFSRSCAN